MNKFFVVTLLISMSLSKWGIEEEEDVGVLTQSNFATFVEENEYVFVKFYAPWCGHCKAMAPAYSSLAKRMKEEEGGIPIAKVDATVETELAEKFGVKGFPTLKMFVNGEPIDYQGAREEEAIYNWIKKKLGPGSEAIETEEKLKEFET